MAKLNCLIKNTQLVEELKGIIAELAYNRMEGGMSIKMPAIYRDIKGLGIEVDAESIGALYNQVFATENSKLLSTHSEIEQFVGTEFRSAQKDITNSIVGIGTLTEKQLGKVSQEKTIAMAMGKLFQKTFYPTLSQTTKSHLLQMQDMVKRAMVNKTPANKRRNNPVSVNSILEDFFNVESMEFDRIDGGINNMESLYREVKREVNNYVDGVTKGMDDTEAELVREQWEGFTKSFMDSMYDIMLSKSQQQKILNEALKNIEIGGKSLIDNNGNIRWSYLSKEGDVDEIKEQIIYLFERGYMDKAGKIASFTPTQARRIAEYLGNLYEQKVASVIQNDVANKRASRLSPKNLISNFLKEQGYFKAVRDNMGKLTKSQTHWDEMILNIERQIAAGNPNVINEIEKQLGDFLNQKDAIGNRVFDITPEKVTEIKKALRDEIKAKLLPASATPNAVEKLAALTKLNAGTAFNESTQQAVQRLVGVPNIAQPILDKINELSALAGKVMENPNTAFAQQLLSQIDRRLRELIFEHKTQTGGFLVSSMQGVEDILSAVKASLLLNPGNVTENMTTNLATSFGETVRILATNPKIFGKIGKEALKSFAAAFASHISGGSHESVVNEYDTLADLSAGERLRFKKTDFDDIKGDLKKGIIQPHASGAKLGLKLFHTAMRTIMNSVDVAVMESIVQATTIDGLNSSLEDAFGKSKAMRLMNKTFDVKPAQIDQMKQEVDMLRSEMNKLGIYPTAFDIKLAERQALNGLYLENLYGQLPATNKETLKQNMHATVKAANEVSKALGGKKVLKSRVWDIASYVHFLGKGILGAQSKIMESVQKSKERGNLKSAQGKQLAATTLIKNGLGSFIGGRLNFLYLALTSTPLGFLSSLSMRRNAKEFLQDHPTAKDIEKASADDFAKYREYMQLSKALMARAIIGSAFMAAYVIAQASDDDDEIGWWDEMINNLGETKSGRNFIAKHFPLFLSMMALVDAQSADKKLQTTSQKIIDVIKRQASMSPATERFVEQLERDKTGDKFLDNAASYVGGLYSGNINQAEQIAGQIDIVESAFDRSKIDKVLSNEDIVKEQYATMESIIEKYMGTGIFATMKRFYEDGEVNRFK